MSWFFLLLQFYDRCKIPLWPVQLDVKPEHPSFLGTLGGAVLSSSRFYSTGFFKGFALLLMLTTVHRRRVDGLRRRGKEGLGGIGL